MSTANDPWGRVADDGTVYVRADGGERVVGSWQAGSPDEALAFYRRKYDGLETEVTLLEQRITTTDLSPGSARATIDRLLEAVATANAVGDLNSLHARLEAVGSDWTVVDDGSTNGTFHNGARLQGPHLLRHGDRS